MHPTCPIPICSKCVLTQSIFFPPSLLMSLIFHAIIYYPNQGYNYTVCEICSCSNLNGSSQFVYWEWRLITNFVISPNATITDGKASLKSLTRFEIRSLWQEGETLTYMPQSFFSQMCTRQINNL